MKNVTAEVAANKNYLYIRHGSNNLLAAIYDVRNVDDIVEAITDTQICKRFSKTQWFENLRSLRDDFGNIGYSNPELKELATDSTAALKVIANMIALKGYAYIDSMIVTLGSFGTSYAAETAQSRTFPGVVPIRSKKASK